MIERARRRQGAGASAGGKAVSPAAAAPPAAAPAGPPPPTWTPEKMRGVLEALRSFVSNQAMKHGVPAREVWDLVRDEVLDPGG